ncbi:MAG TPA: hypothetical protein VGK17_19160 [Propionicimonas sp.]|jgi:hypothetical protein
MPTQDDEAARLAWHEMLRQNDDRAHSDESSRSVAEAVGVLEERLAAANAARHALAEAVVLRDRLLAEQIARIGEVDVDTLRLQEENERLRQRLADLEIRPLRTLPRRTARRLRRSLSSRLPQ